MVGGRSLFTAIAAVIMLEEEDIEEYSRIFLVADYVVVVAAKSKMNNPGLPPGLCFWCVFFMAWDNTVYFGI